MKILFSALSLRKIEEIYDYLSVVNPRAAAKIHNKLLDEVEMLSEQPFMGRVEHLLEDTSVSFRSLVVGKRYKAIYVVEDEVVNMIDIWDCRRDPVRLREEVNDQKR